MERMIVCVKTEFRQSNFKIFQGATVQEQKVSLGTFIKHTFDEFNAKLLKTYQQIKFNNEQKGSCTIFNCLLHEGQGNGSRTQKWEIGW